MAIKVHKSLVNCLKWSATHWERILMLVRISLKSNLSRAHAHTHTQVKQSRLDGNLFCRPANWSLTKHHRSALIEDDCFALVDGENTKLVIRCTNLCNAPFALSDLRPTSRLSQSRNWKLLSRWLRTFRNWISSPITEMGCGKRLWHLASIKHRWKV